MTKYLKPRRGKKATASSQDIILKRGEVFFEVPDDGVGKGIGKIKMGDGVTTYADLPYYMEQAQIDISNTPINFAINSSNNVDVLLGDITTGAYVNTIVGTIKKLLMIFNQSIININENKASIDHNHNEAYYTKSQSDSNYYNKSKVYSKTESDSNYYNKTKVYTKDEVNALIKNITDSTYTKAQVDALVTTINSKIGDKLTVVYDSASKSLDIRK